MVDVDSGQRKRAMLGGNHTRWLTGFSILLLRQHGMDWPENGMSTALLSKQFDSIVAKVALCAIVVVQLLPASMSQLQGERTVTMMVLGPSSAYRHFALV